MIHNSFRRIALAQGLLPTHAGRADFAGTHRETAAGAPVRHEAGQSEEALGFRPPSPGRPLHPSGRQIQV